MSVAQKCLCLSSLHSILLPFQPALATTLTLFCFPAILPVASLLLPSSSRFYFLVFQLLFCPVVSILMSPCIHQCSVCPIQFPNCLLITNFVDLVSDSFIAYSHRPSDPKIYILFLFFTPSHLPRFTPIKEY